MPERDRIRNAMPVPSHNVPPSGFGTDATVCHVCVLYLCLLDRFILFGCMDTDSILVSQGALFSVLDR
jgi:hypothetical protein